LSRQPGLAACQQAGETGGMKPSPDPHYRHRFPVEIISHAVWLYHAFSLSLRDVELILAERCIIVSHETVRRWCQKFAMSFATRLRRRRPQPGDKWHMDEVFIRIQGVQHYLWRAVSQDGVVLDILVQAGRDATAAKRFFKRLLKNLQYVPRAIVTDKLRSYGVAQRQLLPAIEHRQSRYLNNRAENSHRPIRRRERQMQRFTNEPRASSPHTPLFTVTFIPAATDLQPLPCLPPNPVRCVQNLAPGDVRPARSMNGATRLPSANGRPHKVNVTMPSRWTAFHIASERRRDSAGMASLYPVECAT
jgi:putative transposase